MKKLSSLFTLLFITCMSVVSFATGAFADRTLL